MYMHVLEINNMAFMASWVNDYPPLKQEEVNTKEILTNAAKGSAINVGGQIGEWDFITFRNHHGIEYSVSMSGGGALIQSKVFLINQQFIQLMINGSIKEVLSKKNKRFFNSFNIK